MIGTQTQELIRILEEEVADNNEAIPYISAGLNTVTTVINDFTPSINGVQQQILSIVNDINDLKSQQVSIGISANLIGCGIGTTGECAIGVYTVYATNVYWTDYAYAVPDPWEESSAPITSSNLGKGFNLQIVNTDTAVAIGTFCDFSGDIGCASFANQINNLETQIISLQGTLPPLVNGINPVMLERSDYLMQEFAFEQSINILDSDTSTINNSLASLENPTLQQYFLG